MGAKGELSLSRNGRVSATERQLLRISHCWSFSVPKCLKATACWKSVLGLPARRAAASENILELTAQWNKMLQVQLFWPNRVS